MKTHADPALQPQGHRQANGHAKHIAKIAADK
jgi:hypothetical protein